MYKVACLMMQRNESTLIDAWVGYHAGLFGLDNLYVYDNGSDDPYVRQRLEHYRQRGLNLISTFASKADFLAKGDIFTARIHALEAQGGYDFFLPLDCDEFVCAVDEQGNPVLGRAALDACLAQGAGFDGVLTISAAFESNPLDPQGFRMTREHRKTFFAAGACGVLDHGFHDGKARHSEQRKAIGVGYLHLHHRPYAEYQYFCRQKLENLVENFERPTLEAYEASRKDGFHLVPGLLMSRWAYERQFLSDAYFAFPAFRQLLDDLGTPIRSAGRHFDDQGGEAPSSFPRGSIDRVTLDGAMLVINGWIVDPAGQAVDGFEVFVDGRHIAFWQLTRHDRPDVVKSYPGLAAPCGFSASFKARLDHPDTVAIRSEGADDLVWKRPSP